MWNSNKSLKLSAIFTKVVMMLVIVFAFSLPMLLAKTIPDEFLIIDSDEIGYMLPVVYISCVLAFIALFSLNQLLSNIKKEMVFIKKNVQILRRISWCCLIVALLFLLGSLFSVVFLLMSLMAGFVGLILRVVKNVFQTAVEIKAENDFTI